jgi:hypothetical protein
MPVLIDDGDVIPPQTTTTTTVTTTVTTTTAGATTAKSKTLEERGHSKTDSKRSSKLLQHRPGLNGSKQFFYFVMACGVPGAGCREGAGAADARILVGGLPFKHYPDQMLLNFSILIRNVRDCVMIVLKWKRISCKQSARWQHLSQLKASVFFCFSKKC